MKWLMLGLANFTHYFLYYDDIFMFLPCDFLYYDDIFMFLPCDFLYYDDIFIFLPCDFLEN
jgi:hypothetical protein